MAAVLISPQGFRNGTRIAFFDKMKEDEKINALKLILEGSIAFELNMNDTFAFACSDSESMTVEDFELLVPIIAKYGHAAFTAYVAVKRGAEPIDCRCNHKSPEYYAAKKEIEAIKATHSDFPADYD